jgi:hypothetical protein
MISLRRLRNGLLRPSQYHRVNVMNFSDKFKDKESTEERVYIDKEESKNDITLGKLMKRLLEKLGKEAQQEKKDTTIVNPNAATLRVAYI